MPKKPLTTKQAFGMAKKFYTKKATKDVDGELAKMLEDIFGFDVWDDGVEATARRWLRAMKEFSPEPDIDFNFTTFPAKHNQMIVVSDIEFSSICSHHLFPFFGSAHVGYIPNEREVGLSKIPRVVHHFAARPQTQEHLTMEIASFLKHNLAALGVMVVIEAQHTCMLSRGVREHNGVMRTSEIRGIFLTATEAREEFLALAFAKMRR